MSPPADQSQVPMFIKAEDLHRYLDAKFVDVRDEKAYTNGHIYNAVHADDLFTYLLATSSQDDIDKMRAYFQKRFGELGISGREHVIVYEQGINNQYGASCRGFFIFKFMNHPKVSILEGGIDALNRIRNGPLYMTTESTMIEPTEYHEQGDHNDDWQIVGRDEVLQMVLNQRSKTWLLDVRDAVEWKGLSSSPYGVDFTPRKGRIPNAVWTEWYAFHELDQDKNMTRLKSNDQIEKLLQEKGIEKDDHVIVYCFKGSRASLVLMKMKEAGYMNVKNYFASWNEWSRDLQLPVDDTILSNE